MWKVHLRRLSLPLPCAGDPVGKRCVPDDPLEQHLYLEIFVACALQLCRWLCVVARLRAVVRDVVAVSGGFAKKQD